MPMDEIAEAIAELQSAPGEEAAAPFPSPSPEPEQQGELDLGEAPAPAEGRQRDATGKFSPKEVAKAEVKSETAKGIAPAPRPETQAQGPIRAPASWKPEEREGWERLEPRHQQAIIRRERETSNVLAQSAQARQFHQEMSHALEPYLPMITSEGATPVQAVQEIFRAVGQLRTALPMQKAAVLADIIMQHQVDPSLLDTALSQRMRGQPMPNDPMSFMMQQLDQRLQPVTQFMQGLQSQRQQAGQQIQQQAEQTLSEFAADPKNEFMGDVADDMADLLEMAANRGQTLTLQDAYRRATLAHPTISKIMERRMLQNGATQQTAVAQRARQASASITDSGAPSQSVEDGEGAGDVRSALMASMKSLAANRM